MLNFIKKLFANQKIEDAELGGKLGEKGELSKENEYQLKMGEEEVNRCLTLASFVKFGGVNSPMYNSVKRMIKNFDRTDIGLFYFDAICLRRLLTHSISVEEAKRDIENEREFMQKLNDRKAELAAKALQDLQALGEQHAHEFLLAVAQKFRLVEFLQEALATKEFCKRYDMQDNQAVINKYRDLYIPTSYLFDTKMQTYIIDKFFKLNEFEAREQQLAEREAKIIKIEAAQRIINSELVEQINKEMNQT
jgi:hypothetical protein